MSNFLAIFVVLWLCGWQLYTLHLLISGHERRTAPKFGSHVRIDTLTLKKIDPPHPRGFRGLSIVKYLSRRTAPKFGTHMRIDTLTLNKIKKLTLPIPGGFRGLSIVKNLSRRTAPKFGTHVRIDTLTLKKCDPPQPQGGLGGYLVLLLLNTCIRVSDVMKFTFISLMPVHNVCRICKIIKE